MFREAFAQRRCLVPADAFYEWKPESQGKRPYAIAHPDGTPLALAGLWEGFRQQDGSVLRSFAIITTNANAELARLHDRMPAIIAEADWPVWLGEVQGEPKDLLRPAPKGALRAWPIGNQVSNPSQNGPDLLTPIES